MDSNAARLKNRLGLNGRQAVVSIAAVVVSLALSMVVVRLMNLDPFYAFGQLIEGAFGSANALSEVAVKMAPLLFTGMSYALANRCGLINLGMEGQLYMGAIGSTVAGIYVKGLPAFLHLPLALLAGFAGGAVWGLVAAVLETRCNASEVITTVMMNTIAINIVGFLVSGPLMESSGQKTQTETVLETAWLPRITSTMRMHWGFILGLVFVVLFYFFLFKSKKGFEVRMTGQNLQAARYVGVNTNRNVHLVMLLAGGVAGLAGANEILGIQHLMLPVISHGYGFDGVAVSMIGQNSPGGIVLGAFLFGVLRAGGNMMQRRASVPTSIISVIQGFVIIAVVGSNVVLELMHERRLRQAGKQAAGGGR